MTYPGHNLYRVSIEFTDGPHQCDAWSPTPDGALRLGLQDARMLSVNPMRTGKVVSVKVEPVCDLRIDAHSMDDEIEARYAIDYGVTVVERKNAPWEWIFRGTRENLHKMFRECWGDEDASVDGLDIREVRA